MLHRLLMWGQGWPRLFTDLSYKFLTVLAVFAVKIIMSTALTSWVMVAAQFLFTIADISGSSDIFGNRAPLTFIFQALPLVELLLKTGSTLTS